MCVAGPVPGPVSEPSATQGERSTGGGCISLATAPIGISPPFAARGRPDPPHPPGEPPQGDALEKAVERVDEWRQPLVEAHDDGSYQRKQQYVAGSERAEVRLDSRCDTEAGDHDRELDAGDQRRAGPRAPRRPARPARPMPARRAAHHPVTTFVSAVNRASV